MPEKETHDGRGTGADRDSAAMVRVIMEALYDALLFVHADGRIVDANRAAEAMYGYSRSELLSLTISDLRAPETHAAIPEQMRRAARGGLTFETVHRRSDGSYFPVEVSSRGGVLAGEPVLVSVVRDISRRKRQERIVALAHEAGALLRGREALDAGLNRLCDEAADLFGLPLLWVGVKEPDGSVKVRARGGPYGHVVDSLGVRWDSSAAGSGPTGEALRTGRTQLVRLESVPEQPWWRLCTEVGLQHALVAPIIYGDEVLGAISLYAMREGQFDPEVIGLVEHMAAQLALLLIEARNRAEMQVQLAALNAAANAIVITDVKGRITWVNPAFTKLTGYTLEEVLGKNPRILKSGLTPESVFADLWSTITAGGIWTGELVNRRKDGTTYVDQQTITPVRGASGEITHFIAIKVDGTVRRQQEENLRFLATHDPLTGLPNRRGFMAELEGELEKAPASRQSALLMIDLDNFKIINDRLGHAAGDAALVTVAGTIRRELRPTDCAARYGGDEFAVLLRGVTEAEAVSVAERLRLALLEASALYAAHPLSLSASIGVAMVAGSSAADVLRLADEALARAKDLGKNRVVVHRADPQGKRQAGDAWADRLALALAEERLVLHFQPVVRLSDGGIERWETLLRLKEPDGSLLLPELFLPHALRAGVAPGLDLWVIDSALRILAADPDLRLSVNLSVQTLQNHDALAAIERAVINRRPAPGSLMLEVAEAAAVQDLERVSAWMRKMKGLGVCFALDDYGTGASSFGHLRGLAVDVVKLDVTYVQQMLTDPVCAAFVQALAVLGRALGVATVAEGVESAETVDLLKSYGVQFGQGYYWAKPGPLP